MACVATFVDHIKNNNNENKNIMQNKICISGFSFQDANIIFKLSSLLLN